MPPLPSTFYPRNTIGDEVSFVYTVKMFRQFLMARKKWWITPLIVVLVLLAMIIFFSRGTAGAPFVYTLF